MKPTITIISIILALISIALMIFIKVEFFMITMFPLVLFCIDLFTMDDTRTNIFSGLIYFFRIKRVKTEHGKFFVVIRDDGYVTLHQDKFFYLKYIDYTSFYGIEQMKIWVKQNYENLYQKQLLEDNKKKELNSKIKQIKSWNGYIDTQGERDGKLKDIGV